MRRTTAMVLIALLLGGCESIQELVATAPRPEASVQAARLTDLTLDAATIELDVQVINPYAAALPMSNVRFALASGGQAFLDGTVEGMTLPARGTGNLTIPARVRFVDLLSALEGVRPGAIVPYEADVVIAVDAPGVGPLELPVRHTGTVPVPAVPKIRVVDVVWDDLDLRRVGATATLEIKNTNSFRAVLNTFDYRLRAGEHELARSVVSEPLTLDGGDKTLVEIPVSVSVLDLGMSAIDMLMKSDSVLYHLQGTFECDTEFGALSLPYEWTGRK